MNDLVVRLKLNSQQWDTNVGKARQSIRDISATAKQSTISIEGMGKAFSGVGAAIGKVSGIIGGAMAVLSTAEFAINSSATAQAEYNDVLNAGKKSVNDFFNSLLSGDWTRYNNGILEAIKLNKEFAKSQRNLSDWKNLTESRLDQTDALTSNLEAIIEDSTRPLEERKQAYNELNEKLSKTIQQTEKELVMAEKDLTNILQNLGVSDEFNKNNIKEIYNEITNPYSDLLQKLEQYEKDKDVIDNWKNPNIFRYTENESQMLKGKEQFLFGEKYSKEIQDYYNALLRLRENLTDENKEILKEYVDDISQISDRLGTVKKDLKGAAETISDAADDVTKSTTTSASKNKEVIPTGSLAYFNNLISELQKKLELATSDGVAYGINREINKLRTLKLMLELRQTGTSPLESILTNSGRNAKDDIESGYISNIPTFKPINDNVIDGQNIYNESLNTTLSLFNSIANVTDSATSSWLNYIGNVATGIASLIPQITTLIGLKSKQVVVEGMASAAQTPVIGWITAIGAAASLIAAIASIPQFATGGIVGGTSFTGDNILARVNSGEMILNPLQQSKLFNMINNGIVQNNEVTFRINGKDLVGTLNNYNSKQMRY